MLLDFLTTNTQRNMVEKKKAGEPSEEVEGTENTGLDNESAESSEPQNEEILELIKKFSPDCDVSTPQAIINAASQVIKAMEPIYDKTYDLALSAPEAAAFINDLLETGNVPKSLARNYDPDELKVIWDEVQDDSNEEDRTSHAEKVTKVKSKIATLNGNMAISMKNISDFMEKREHWPPEKADEFEQKVIQFYQDGADGLISEEALSLLEKGLMHDDDVTEAEENGKIIGKNEKIVAKKLSKEKENELLPELNGGTAQPSTAEDNTDPFLSRLKQRAEQKPILS